METSAKEKDNVFNDNHIKDQDSWVFFFLNVLLYILSPLITWKKKKKKHNYRLETVILHSVTRCTTIVNKAVFITHF